MPESESRPMIDPFRYGLVSSIVDQESYARSIRRFREAQIILPTFAELADPSTTSLEIQQALATVDDAIKGTDDVSGRAWEAELHRLRGTILLAAHVGVHDDSERCFNKAIAAARRQGARSLELRATTELSRLWQGQGKTRQARDLLAPVHDWFTEGLDTADLKEAKALLEDLS